MSADELPRRIFLAELDTLLDTRASILFNELGEEKTIKIIRGGYFDRVVDDFPDLPFDKFRELYRNRDKSVLVNALATKVIDIAKQYIFSVRRNVIASPHHYEPVLLINTHPYKLTDEETAVIHKMVSARIGNSAEVEFIDLPYEKIGNKFLQKNDVSYLAIYDYVDYLNKHTDTKEFEEYKSPETGFIIPQMVFSRPGHKSNPYVNNAFQIVEDVVGPFLSVNYMPVKDFCVSIRIPERTK